MTQSGFIKFTKKSLITILGVWVIIVSSGLLYLFGPWTHQTSAAWFDDNWAFRKAITITTTTATETNRYVALSSYDASDTTRYQSDCGDVRFTAQNGEVLDYTVTSCGASTTFNINMRLLPLSTTTVYLYYGNPSAIDGFVATNPFAVCTNCSAGTPDTEEKGPGPTLYWRFDDAQGATAQDASTNNFDGTLNNTPTWQTEDQCIAGKCLWFSGTANMNVSKSDDGKLDFVAADNFTVSAWVKRNGASSAINYILTKAQAGYTGYKLYQDASGDYCFDVRDGTNLDSACTSAVEFDDDKWHFVQGVKAGTTSITLYVDGKQRAQDASIAATGTLANTGTFYVGVDLDGTSNEWLGFIDEVKVYRDQASRTAGQILADYNARGIFKGASNNLGGSNLNLRGLSDGLVGYWKMEESATPSFDSSGNGNSGTWNNQTAQAAGKFGYSTTFDGTDDVIRVTEVASNPLDLGAATQSYTVSAWIKTSTDFSSQTAIVYKAAGGNDYPFRLGLNATSEQAVFQIDATDTNLGITGTTSLNNGSWHHVVGVRSVGDKKLYLYVDGVQQASDTDTTTGTLTNDDDVSIGNGGSSYTSADFNGQIDEVRIYNRALSNTDVANLYNFTPGPVGYWKFDEKTGTSAEDSSSLGNQATLTNTPTWITGKYGSAISFAGSDQNVQRADDADFDFGTGASFTYGAWIKHAATPATVERIITKYDNTAGNGGFALQIETDGDLTCGIDDDETSFPEDSATSTAATYDDNLWHYITCVKDGTTGLYLYIDGVLIASDTTISSTGDFANADPLYIGIAEDGTSNDFIGQIDEPKIYNYARTSGQVVEDMNALNPAPGSPVRSALGYWKFDEGVDNICSGGTNDACNSGNAGNTLDGAESSMAVPATSTSGWTNSGKFGKALIFDATDDLVNAGSGAAIDDLTANPMSLSAWIYPNTMGESNQGVIMAKNSGATPSSGWLWQLTTTNTMKFSVDGTTDLVVTASNSKLTTAAWNYVALSWDGTFTDATKVHLYVNGNEVTYQTQTSGATRVSDAASSLYFGNDSTAASTFDGTLDEVKIYNSALAADQIKMDMNRGSAQLLGALSDNSSYQVNAANQEYCIPGDSTSCAMPVAEWKMDEKTGTTAYDSSGNGYNLTLTNTPTYTTGQYGAGINFSASTSDNDHLTRADTAALDFAAGGSFTIEAWFKHTTQTSGTEVLLSKFNEAGYKIEMVTDGDIRCGLDYDSTWTPTDSAISTLATYDDNKWHHVACRKDANTSLVILIDGIPQGQDTSLTNSTLANTDPIYLGIDADGTSNDFTGQLDQVKIFNYARSQAQIVWDFNRGGPTGWWKFDECTGASAFDASVNASTGTFAGTGGGNTSTGDCVTVLSTAARYNGRVGKLNAGLDFDGTDDNIDMGDPAAAGLDVPDTSNFTIDAWVNRDTFTADHTIVAKKTTQASNTQGYLLWIDDATDDIRLVVSDGDGVNLHTVDSTSTITATGWHHIVVTYDDSSSTASKIYIDGKDDNATNTTTGTFSLIAGLANTIAFRIGSDSNATPANFFDGKIDNVKFYKYALTATQARTAYNEGAAYRVGPVTGSP